MNRIGARACVDDQRIDRRSRAACARAIDAGGDGASIGGENYIYCIGLSCDPRARENAVDEAWRRREQNSRFQFLEPRKMCGRPDHPAAPPMGRLGIPRLTRQLMVK